VAFSSDEDAASGVDSRRDAHGPFDTSFLGPGRDHRVVPMGAARWPSDQGSSAEEALELALARFDTLLANAPIGFAFVDADFRFVLLNEPLARINGISVEDHLGRSLAEVVPDVWPVIEPDVRAVLATGTPRTDVEVSGQTGAEPGIERHWLAGFHPVTDRAGRARGVGFTFVEVTERRRAERAAVLLGGLSELLATGEDLGGTMAAAVASVAPEFADCCIACVTTPDREVVQLASIRRAADSGEVVATRPDTCPVELDDGTAVGRRLGEGRTILAERLDGYRPVEGTEVLVADYGARSTIVVPLRPGGQFFGLVAFLYTAASGRHYRADDLHLAEQLADRLGHVLLNVQLTERAARAQVRLELLARAGRMVESELDVVARAGAVARLAVPDFADHATVFLVEAGANELRFIGGAHRDPALTELMNSVDWPPIDMGGATAPALAVRAGEPVLRPYQPSDGPAQYLLHDHPELTAALQTRSMLAVPLRTGGVTLGVLSFAFEGRGRRYEANDITLAEELARMAAPAISNALRFEHEHVTGETLQRSLLPIAPPSLAGMQVATRYIPGTAGLQVGGDFYDVVELADDVVVLAIGDVVGHSIEAAISMGRFRTALQFSARRSDGPSATLTMINELMSEAFGTDMATLLLVSYDQRTGRASVASAGHLPALLLAANGEVSFMELPPGLPLCVDGGAVYETAWFEIGAGDSIVLYTDGLIERRGETLDEGFARLRQSCAGAAGGPDAIADDVLSRLVPADGPADDVALLVARIGVSGTTLDLELPAQTAFLGVLRRGLLAWLAGAGATDEEAGDIVLAANEAVANAVEHAYGHHVPGWAPGWAPGWVRVRGTSDTGVITLSVSDDGGWRQSLSDDARGRGFIIMRAVMDEVDITRADEGTTIRLRRALSRARRPVRS